ncbi:hypothetical protein [Streptomyces sp. NRRL S-118]|uniref:hypothetical protein n=1 Tax=Streptomyces sp. NRRL S-118 TaxID=1463881 RepID=UPI00131AE5ED|nr:hypothetical protein [Streptomyces sp. NRRL S-118]
MAEPEAQRAQAAEQARRTVQDGQAGQAGQGGQGGQGSGPGAGPAGQGEELAAYTAALCLLLTERDGSVTAVPEVRAAVEHTRSLLTVGGGGTVLLAAFRALDEELRRAGDARGLGGRSRGAATTPPGIRRVIKVARCPGAVPCARREPAPDLRPAPRCAVNGVRMRREQLRRDA